MAKDADFDNQSREHVAKAKRFATKRNLEGKRMVTITFTLSEEDHATLRRLGGRLGNGAIVEKLIRRADAKVKRMSERANAIHSEKGVVDALLTVHDRPVTTSPKQSNA